LPSLATGATVESGEGVFVSQGTFFLGCLGATVTEDSRIPFRYRRTVSPSGNVHYSEMFVPGTGTGTFIEQPTGTRWTLERIVSPLVSNVNNGETFFFTATNWWRREDGRVMHLHPNYHLKVNAAGEVTLEFNNGKCAVK
jgi:hypothetical protein